MKQCLIKILQWMIFTYTIKNAYNDEISCVYSDYNSDKLIFRIAFGKCIK